MFGTTDYDDTLSWDSTANDYALVTFTGTKLQLYGQVGPAYGIAQIQIDEGATFNVDFYASANQGNDLVFSTPAMVWGRHTVRVLVTGTHGSGSGNTVAIDRAVITG